MSTKPKSSDYKPSEMEKTSAAVAQAEYNRFKEKYDPLLLNMRDQSLSDDPTRIARGRANADTMQALTSQTSLRQATDVGSAASIAGGLSSQLGQATATGKQIQAKDQTNVLGTRRGQAADSSSGMSQLARMNTSEGLARAANRQAVAQSKFDAGMKIFETGLAQGISNKFSGPEGTFFTPAEPGVGGKPIKGIKNRLNYMFGN